MNAIQIAQLNLKSRTNNLCRIALTNDDVTYELPQVLLDAYVASNRNSEYICDWWEAESQRGWKMENDNPYHTDILIYLGIDISDTSLKIIDDLISSYHFSVVSKNNELMHCRVYSNPNKLDYIEGVVFHYNEIIDYPKNSIIIIPYADYRLDHIIRNYKAVITKIGSSLCHLSKVSREENRVLVHCVDELINGQFIRIDLTNSIINIKECK